MKLQLFLNRNFSLTVLREAISVFLNIFINVSFALYILNVTGSAGKFASILTLGLIPYLVAGPIAGSFVDRMANKGKLLMWLDGMRGLYLVILFIVSLTGHFPQQLVYVTVMFLATCNMFGAPAFITIMPSIVKKEELTAANALQSTIVETSSVLAPFLGTLIYSTSGIGTVLLVTGAASLVSSLASFFMKIPLTERKQVRASYTKDFLEGLRVFQTDVRITSLIINGMLTHIFMFPFAMIGFPYMIKQVFGGTDLDFGTVESIQTVGSLCSIFAVTYLQKRYPISKNIGIGIVGMILAVLPMVLLGSETILLLLQDKPLFVLFYFSFISFLLFLMFNTYGVFFRTFYQQNVAPDVLGRFVAVMVMLFAIGRFVGFQIFGLLFDSSILVWSVFVLGIGMLLKLLVHIPFLIHDRKIRESQSQEKGFT